MATSRIAVNVWAETFDRLKKISEATDKPMTELLDEAVFLLEKRYTKTTVRVSDKESL
jgi:hypothetical protein